MRHLVPCLLSNQPMFHGHGQSETDLFHPAVRRDSHLYLNLNSYLNRAEHNSRKSPEKTTSLQWKRQWKLF